LFIKDLDYEHFSKDEKTLYAVSRCFEIIAEAVVNIPDELKEKYSNIEWQKIKDFRNVIVHKYWILDSEIIWDIIKNHLKDLKKEINDILKNI
jgi:uncharacterized protein with HEPN domain